MSTQALQTMNGGTVARPTAEEPALTLTPRIDVLETDDELTVLADMPGVRPEDVDVRFENGDLTVNGRRTNGAGYFRSFRLTEQIAADKIEAGLSHGVLKLRLPKVDAVKPRRIAVKGS
jgi:HSP20 family protein